ncbi:actin-histidine N-methyltransferase isoform X2 [Phoenix dactylifera]|nr:actin-histidine N-methyltransferase isoform X2 [Phoenix dactylifera]
MINSLLTGAKTDIIQVLQVLKSKIITMINSVGVQNIDEMIIEKLDAGTEEMLLIWGEDHGVRTKLKIAHFKEAGRGAVASEDISMGDIALEIPESLIISEDLVRESDMYDPLKQLDDITSDTMLLLWSMRERYNSNSRFKIFFDTLPEEFNTGLSFGVDALAVLEGTLLLEELLQAKQLLRQQYDALCPKLCANHPKIFQQELYTWDKFLWACELWYSNGMKVVLSDGKLGTCLVPIAGLLNHSLCPHILHYGRVDQSTKSLKFRVSRSCKAGEQCYLSYGTFPGSHLITFYGFLPKGDNPYDVMPLDFDDCCNEDGRSNEAWTGESSRTTHMVRGTWLSKSDKPHAYGLPPPLLAHLRSVLKGDGIEQPPEGPKPDIHKENERAVLETVLSIFNPMLEGIGDSDDFERDNSRWDVKLAADYKDLQRRIISSVTKSCYSGLEMLDASA